jgi:hypothetical protein
MGKTLRRDSRRPHVSKELGAPSLSFVISTAHASKKQKEKKKKTEAVRVDQGHWCDSVASETRDSRMRTRGTFKVDAP